MLNYDEKSDTSNFAAGIRPQKNDVTPNGPDFLSAMLDFLYAK